MLSAGCTTSVLYDIACYSSHREEGTTPSTLDQPRSDSTTEGDAYYPEGKSSYVLKASYFALQPAAAYMPAPLNCLCSRDASFDIGLAHVSWLGITPGTIGGIQWQSSCDANVAKSAPLTCRYEAAGERAGDALQAAKKSLLG